MGLICKQLSARPRRLPAAVISVGNLTLGGTGKTPAVIAIAEEARKRGLSPCVLTRGYRGRSKGPCFVESRTLRNEAGAITFCEDPGDEPALMGERLQDIPVVKCADRYAGGLFYLDSALSSGRSHHLFILDDGFQHWRLHRDVDILLVDATDPFGNERLFPEGRLREPLSAMKRAHAIVITRTDTAGKETGTKILQRIRTYNPEAPVYMSSHRPYCLVERDGGQKGIDTLRGRKVHAFAGIANPEHFRDTLASIGARVASFSSFSDHHRYTQKDFDRIGEQASGAEMVITTEKDLVKLRKFTLPDNLYALRIMFSVEEGFYSHIFGALSSIMAQAKTR